MKKTIMLFAFAIALQGTASAQFGGLLKKTKEAVKKEAEKTIDKKNEELKGKAEKAAGQATTSVAGATAGGGKTIAKGEIPKGTATLYVSAARGSSRSDGSKASPLKDIQKAVDKAPEGAVIMVAEGNYLGNMDLGFIKITKYLSVVGGYSDDFSQRDPVKYKTMIQPGSAAGGTNGSFGLFDVYVKGNRNGSVLIDGFILDKGQMNKYVIPDPPNPKFKAPEGCETSLLNPPGMQISQPSMRGVTTVSNQLIHGDVEGNVTIRNCVFLNGSHFGIQMGNIGGKFDIYNNVFLASRMAACEVRSMNKTPGEAVVDFHDNTVLFTWRRDWAPDRKDMGYGFRFMTGIDANVYNNIFGCSDFAALDRTYVDADKNKEAQRKTSAWNNLFFNNLEADLTMPSGGGKFARIFAKQFEDGDQLVKYEGNREMTESEVKTISRAIDAPYLKGFLSMTGTSSMEHNPNSSENVFRQAMGMNMRGTSSFSVSMYANSYPFDKAFDLFGAMKGYGAQAIK